MGKVEVQGKRGPGDDQEYLAGTMDRRTDLFCLGLLYKLVNLLVECSSTADVSPIDEDVVVVELRLCSLRCRLICSVWRNPAQRRHSILGVDTVSTRREWSR